MHIGALQLLQVQCLLNLMSHYDSIGPLTSSSSPPPPPPSPWHQIFILDDVTRATAHVAMSKDVGR